MNNDQPNENQELNSHVTNAEPNISGENFDPKIRVQIANEPSVIHASRNPESVNRTVSPENAKRHEEAVQKYPNLNLSEEEFVIISLRRHPIGLLLPVLATGLLLVVLIAVLVLYPSGQDNSLPVTLPSYNVILMPVLLLMLLVGIGGAVAIWVYLQNQFYLTNESVIQEIQYSLFSRHEQTVSLGSIEDASYKQSGILQMMFDYGTVRLSTEGEETTYRFSYVANPRAHIATLNNAIESFKNGRAVDPYEN
jgi:uncharacterized membrane protein YdbT with pleckstrin-like domain